MAKNLLDRVTDAINKKLGRPLAHRIEEGAPALSEVRSVIPTGISVFDHWLAALGGLPCGRITEIFGPEGTGKTAFIASCLAAAQREGGIANYVDNERSFDEERFQLFGVKTDDLILSEPDTVEEATQSMIEVVRCLPDDGPPSIIAWDSIAATPPKSELDGDMEDNAMGVRARKIGQACRILLPLASKKNVALVFVNQIRMKIGIVYGNPETTPGGEAIKFAVSLKVRMGAGKPVKVGKEMVGKDVPMRVVKTRFSPPFRTAMIRFNYLKGWDEKWSTLSHAKDLKIVEAGARGDKAYEDAIKALGWKASPLANNESIEAEDSVIEETDE